MAGQPPPPRAGTVALKAGLAYFALVFGTGFVLGAIRVPLLVPRFGVRWAELAEMPLMAVAIVVAARFVVCRMQVPPLVPVRWLVGGIAWLALVGAELTLAVVLQHGSVGAYIASRDPVSGTVYLLMLVVYAAMPRLLLLRMNVRAAG